LAAKLTNVAPDPMIKENNGPEYGTMAYRRKQRKQKKVEKSQW
jgi:hypothetical protein